MSPTRRAGTATFSCPGLVRKAVTEQKRSTCPRPRVVNIRFAGGLFPPRDAPVLCPNKILCPNKFPGLPNWGRIAT